MLNSLINKIISTLPGMKNMPGKKFAGNTFLAITICCFLLAGNLAAMAKAAPQTAENAQSEAPGETDSVNPSLPVQDGGPEIDSASAIIMDINSGAVLYAKNQADAHQPSSLTKLVTALVCAQNLSMSTSVSFSAEAASQNFPTASNAGFRTGDTTFVSDALTAMIMCSADDCAVALAEKCGGSVTGFAEMMNKYASDNGFINSSFMNAGGRHTEGHYTCAYDMALAASRLMNDLSEFKTAASETSATLSASGSSLSELTISNTHRFIKGTDSYSYCYAGKTGGTAYGGDETWSLCTFASHNNMNLVCIIMGAPSNDSTYADTKLLFDYAFENYRATTASSFVASGSSEIGTLFNNDLLFASDNMETIYVDRSATILLPAGADEAKITYSVNLDQIHEFIYGENIIGNLDFYYGDRHAGTADILFYTENASMPQSEFNKYFPDFLLSPENTQGTNIYNDFGGTDTVENKGFFDKIKAGIYSLYTPAKSFAAICTLFIFLIGLLIIFLVFPIEVKREDTLYKQDMGDLYYSAPEDELSEVRAMRNPDVDDMHEIK